MNEELKPFENSTILNGPCKLLVNVQKAQDLMHQIKWLKDDMAELHRDASIGAVQHIAATLMQESNLESSQLRRSRIYSDECHINKQNKLVNRNQTNEFDQTPDIYDEPQDLIDVDEDVMQPIKILHQKKQITHQPTMQP